MLDMLSLHAVKTNHRVGKARHTIPAYTAKYVLYKRGCRSPKQQRADKQLQHLRRLDKRHEAYDYISSARTRRPINRI